MKRLSVFITCLSVSIASHASATVIYVPADQPTIQEGIDAALSGDTVQVASGTYTGPGNRDISFDGKGLLVKSEAGADSTIIDCQGSFPEPHRGFHFGSGEDSTAVLSGFTIRNGYAPAVAATTDSLGGGILCDGTSPSIFNCVLEANSAASGGGGMACINDASPRIVRCRFENNLGEPHTHIWEYEDIVRGGALRCVSSSPVVQSCVFIGNLAPFGAAISCTQSNIQVERCDFISNTAYRLWQWGFEPEGGGQGGAMHMDQSSPFVAFCTFAGNVAEEDPVGITGLRPGRGGAIRMYASDPMITNCTFYANAALRVSGYPGEGGALSLIYSSPVIQRCIIAGSLDGEAVFRPSYDSLSQATFLCCDLFDNAGGDWIGFIADQLGTQGNISSDPLFCDTSTSDFSLQNASPCGPLASGCELIGAWPVGCDSFAQDTLWLPGEESNHVVNHAPLFSWNQAQVFPQTEYEIQVGNDPDWTTAEMWQPGVLSGAETTVGYDGAPLLDGVTYYARVRVGDGSIWSTWLPTSFTMNSVPLPPTQVAPLDTAEIAAVHPVLTTRVSPDLDMDSQLVQSTVWQVTHPPYGFEWITPFSYAGGGFQGDSLSWQIEAPLRENQLYRWAARATDGYELSFSSPDQLFWVNAVEEEPGTPILYQPAANAMIYAAHPSLVWSFATDPDPNATVWYELVVAGDSTFLAVVEADSLTDTSHTLTAALETGRQFWWKVICQSSDGQSAASQKRPFGMYLPGDVNGTWTVTSADIIALVGYVFRGALLTVPECAGRTNGDGVITSADIIWLVNAVFKSGPIPIAGCE